MEKATLVPMAPSRKRATPPAPPATRALTAEEFRAWLRDQIGATKHEAFAKDIGVTRQALSMVLIGRRPAGARFLKRLAKVATVSARRLYVVEEPTKTPVVK